MGKVIDVRDRDGTIAMQRATTVEVLRALADRLEGAPLEKLVQALPVSAGAAEDLDRRLAPWLR